MNRIEMLRKIADMHKGKYADAYKLGLDVADGIIEPAQDPGAMNQGYRDGLKLRPWRVKPSGKITPEQNRAAVAKHRKKLKNS